MKFSRKIPLHTYLFILLYRLELMLWPFSIWKERSLQKICRDEILNSAQQSCIEFADFFPDYAPKGENVHNFMRDKLVEIRLKKRNYSLSFFVNDSNRIEDVPQDYFVSPHESDKYLSAIGTMPNHSYLRLMEKHIHKNTEIESILSEIKESVGYGWRFGVSYRGVSTEEFVEGPDDKNWRDNCELHKKFSSIFAEKNEAWENRPMISKQVETQEWCACGNCMGAGRLGSGSNTGYEPECMECDGAGGSYVPGYEIEYEKDMVTPRPVLSIDYVKPNADEIKKIAKDIGHDITPFPEPKRIVTVYMKINVHK